MYTLNLWRKMKSFVVIASTMAFSSFGKAFAQPAYFEGKIILEETFQIKDSTMRAVLFSHLNPGKVTQYFKEGNSFESYDKGENKSYLYIRAENKVYLNHWNDDSLYFYDCSGKGRDILHYSMTKNAEIILGLSCDKLQISYAGGTSTYYFNEKKLPINPAWYARLTFINWDTISAIMKSIALKTIIDRPDYRIVSTVRLISYEQVPDSYFTIPQNTILVQEN
ncbi:MAG: hypothetical protein JWQ27_101 [Ferruginibacter sp.]|nr:hypothetical protein [Ferruginibacter sp.]